MNCSEEPSLVAVTRGGQEFIAYLESLDPKFQIVELLAANALRFVLIFGSARCQCVSFGIQRELALVFVRITAFFSCSRSAIAAFRPLSEAVAYSTQKDARSIRMP